MICIQVFLSCIDRPFLISDAGAIHLDWYFMAILVVLYLATIPLCIQILAAQAGMIRHCDPEARRQHRIQIIRGTINPVKPSPRGLQDDAIPAGRKINLDLMANLDGEIHGQLSVRISAGAEIEVQVMPHG
ncbi:hypothetical protein D3C86_1651580 [compost metagenome]